jgi:hypothetical protein
MGRVISFMLVPNSSQQFYLLGDLNLSNRNLFCEVLELLTLNPMEILKDMGQLHDEVVVKLCGGLRIHQRMN